MGMKTQRDLAANAILVGRRPWQGLLVSWWSQPYASAQEGVQLLHLLLELLGVEAVAGAANHV